MAETVRFHLPSNPNLYVDLKKRFSWADGRALQMAKVTAVNPEAGNVAFADAMLDRAVVAWNLKDEQGNDIPLPGENKGEYLSFEDAQVVIAEASKAMAGMAKADLPNSSTARSASSPRAARARTTPTSTS